MTTTARDTYRLLPPVCRPRDYHRCSCGHLLLWKTQPTCMSAAAGRSAQRPPARRRPHAHRWTLGRHLSSIYRMPLPSSKAGRQLHRHTSTSACSTTCRLDALILLAVRILRRLTVAIWQLRQ